VQVGVGVGYVGGSEVHEQADRSRILYIVNSYFIYLYLFYNKLSV